MQNLPEMGEKDAYKNKYQRHDETFEIDDMSSTSLGIAGLDISERESADVAIGQVDEAISKVSSQRGSLGAMQSRMQHRVNYLEVAEEYLI